MLEKLIGKEVEIKVAFGHSYSSGGSVPTAYTGIIKDIDEEYLLLSLTSTKTQLSFRKEERALGNLYIKKEFIISCYEINWKMRKKLNDR